ncbi:SprA-related family [Shewanella psychrophila]|uniref:SprA-related family n=1 Tax=Shewanella psychrophila TaxID=225848 RepID=A0A1S6HLG8_9GAMM|nr:putative metalloprotease CJM1_0395 family protein [Shewanella psychrophila]AQS36349.1 SprA-related family [Shewanella psychrophila]
MLGVSASPDIPVGARVSPISLSANSAETSSVTSTKLSAQVATPIPTINSPAHLKSTDSTLGLDKTVRLHSSNIVDLSRGPSDLVSEINFGVNSTSISNSSDSNLSGNLSGSNSSQVSFSLNLGPLSVAGLVKGTGHGTEAFPRFSSHNAMSEPQSNISPFDHSQANKGQGQEVNQERRNTGAFPSDGVGEDEKEAIFRPFAGAEQVANTDEPDTKNEEAKREAIVLLEQQLLQELSSRDAEVKAHEQAHSTVGGNLAQSPQFSYEKGSDGRRYAVDGEVQIDIAVVVGDPLATVNKMKKVYAAAMAPTNPSMADIRVASEALKKLNDAKAQLIDVRQEKPLNLDEMKPLISAESAIRGQVIPEPHKPQVFGEIDENGVISSSLVDSPSSLDDVFTLSPLIERINEQIPSSADPSSEASSESPPVELSTGTLSFGAERVAKHYATNAFTQDAKADSFYQSV